MKSPLDVIIIFSIPSWNNLNFMGFRSCRCAAEMRSWKFLRLAKLHFEIALSGDQKVL